MSRCNPGNEGLGVFSQVNGEDLTQASHYRAQQVLAHYFPVCRLTVYREKAEDNRPIEKEGNNPDRPQPPTLSLRGTLHTPTPNTQSQGNASHPNPQHSVSGERITQRHSLVLFIKLSERR